MKMKMNKPLTFLLALIFLFLFSGCVSTPNLTEPKITYQSNDSIVISFPSKFEFGYGTSMNQTIIFNMAQKLPDTL